VRHEMGVPRDAWLHEDATDVLQQQALDIARDPAASMRMLQETETIDDRVTVSLGNRMKDAEYVALLASLNPGQREVFDHVSAHVQRMYSHPAPGADVDETEEGEEELAPWEQPDQQCEQTVPPDTACDAAGESGRPPPLRMFISGGGGTGKSFLLRAINELINRSTARRGCLVCAPTGVAAFNVSGRTIHNAFAIPVDQKHDASGDKRILDKLTGRREQEKLNLLRHVDYLIIDEISMVSDRLLSLIHHRLDQLKVAEGRRGSGRVQRTFGGISLIFVGDFYQLKPVRGSYAFYHPQLWKDEFTLFELQVNERQAKDNQWTDVLNGIRVGKHIPNHVKLLRTRMTMPENGATVRLQARGCHDENAPEWADALRIFPTNALCREYNDRRTAELRRTQTTIYEFDAEHVVINSRDLPVGGTSHAVPADWIPESDDDCGGLTAKLRLGVGSRIMLRRNVNIADGLVNGATGVVISFEWANGATDQQEKGELPERVWVKFDNPRVGRLQQAGVWARDSTAHGPVYIVTACSQFSGIGAGMTRTLQRVQLPLMLCWAATVHKVQGLTLDRAVVCLAGIFCPAQAYVALSRVRSLEGLLISHWPADNKIARAHADVEAEYARFRNTQGRMHLMPAILTLHSTRKEQEGQIVVRPKTKQNKAPKKNEVYEVESIMGKVRDAVACVLCLFVHVWLVASTWPCISTDAT
jgi:ATP-dependent DNA helicase PIF1